MQWPKTWTSTESSDGKFKQSIPNGSGLTPSGYRGAETRLDCFPIFPDVYYVKKVIKKAYLPHSFVS